MGRVREGGWLRRKVGEMRVARGTHAAWVDVFCFVFSITISHRGVQGSRRARFEKSEGNKQRGEKHRKPTARKHQNRE